MRQLYQQNSADPNSQLTIQFSQNAERIYAEYYLLYKIIEDKTPQQANRYRMQNNNYQTQQQRQKQLQGSAYFLEYFNQKITNQAITSKASQLMNIITNINNPQMEDESHSFVYGLSQFYREFKQAKQITQTSTFCRQNLDQQNLQRILQKLTKIQINKFVPGTNLSSSDRKYGMQFICCIFEQIFDMFYFSQIYKSLLNEVTSLLSNSNQPNLKLLNMVLSIFLNTLRIIKKRDLYQYIQNKAYQQFLSRFLREGSSKLKQLTMDQISFIQLDYLMLKTQLEEIDRLIKGFEELLNLIEKKRQEQQQSNIIFNVFINSIQVIRKYVEEIGGYLEQIRQKIQHIAA